MPIVNQHMRIGVSAIGEVEIRQLHWWFVVFFAVITLTITFSLR
jgi:hypothetical protein